MPLFQMGMGGQNLPVKVTVINEQGLVVLDTLIKPCIDGLDNEDVESIINYKSQ